MTYPVVKETLDCKLQFAAQKSRDL